MRLQVKTLSLCVAVMAACCGASLARASLNVGDIIVVKDVLSNGFNGGAFGIALKSAPSNVLFNTFCLEKNEFLNYANGSGLPSFRVDSISSGAVNGGEGGQTSPGYDPLGAQAAWLFHEYTTGNLTSYDGSGVKESQLQNAIWKYEGEGNNIGGAGDLPDAYYFNLAAAAMANDPDFAVKVARVKVLNISWHEGGGSSYPTGTPAQSLLYVVPEASTIAVWSVLSLIGAGLAYRRNSKAPE